MTIRNLLILFIAFGLSLKHGKAQNLEGKTWLGIAYEQEVAKELELGLEQSLRLGSFATRFNSTLSEIGLTYKPKRYIRLGVKYRFTAEDGGFIHRFSGFVTPRWKTKKVITTLRLMYQNESERNEALVHGLRQKLSIKYVDFKDWRPYLYGELFYEAKYDFKYYNRYRIGFGNEIDIRKGHDLDIALFYQQAFNAELPQKSLTLSLAYIFNP